MSSDVMQYVFYIILVCVSGAGEYFHLVPMGTLAAVLGLITGHFFGNGATKQVLSSIATNVSTVTSQVKENSDIAKGIAQTSNVPIVPLEQPAKENTPT